MVVTGWNSTPEGFKDFAWYWNFLKQIIEKSWLFFQKERLLCKLACFFSDSPSVSILSPFCTNLSNFVFVSLGLHAPELMCSCSPLCRHSCGSTSNGNLYIFCIHCTMKVLVQINHYLYPQFTVVSHMFKLPVCRYVYQYCTSIHRTRCGDIIIVATVGTDFSYCKLSSQKCFLIFHFWMISLKL